MYTLKNWDSMVLQGVGSEHQVEPIPVTSAKAVVVDIRRRDRDSYGEGFEGDGGYCYVIFQVGNRFFRRTFAESSFNENELYWYSDVEEVFGEVKTVTTFVRKEQ